jgi:hypothetical protein
MPSEEQKILATFPIHKKLYLLPGEHRSGCRMCNSLIYSSSQQFDHYGELFTLLATTLRRPPLPRRWADTLTGLLGREAGWSEISPDGVWRAPQQS